MTNLKEKTLKSILLNTTVITTLSIAVVYVMGYFYAFGYLTKFGLNHKYFPLSIHEHLINSYEFFIIASHKLFLIITKNFFSWYLLAFIALFAFFAFIIFLVKNKDTIKSTGNGFFNKIRKTNFYHYLCIPFLGTIYSFFIVFSFSIFILVPAIFGSVAYFSGSSSADKSKVDFKGCDLAELSKKDSCVFVLKGDTEVLSGKFLAKSSSSIALWDGKKTIVYPLNNEKIEIRFGEK